MELVADRFVVVDGARSIDLASGDEVELVISTSGGRSEQLRWTERCDMFSRVVHPAIARLVDYGVFGEMKRFEAWRCGSRWGGPRVDAERAIRVASIFLHANAMTPGLSWNVPVRKWNGRPVVLPSQAIGSSEDAPDASCEELTIEGCGISLMSRRSVRALAELFEHPGRSRVRTVALWGAPGSGVGTAVSELARTARLNGYVSLAVGLADPKILDALSGRSLFLIDRFDGSAACRKLLESTLRSPGAHVLLLAGREEVADIPGLPLERVTPSDLAGTIRPYDVSTAIRTRVDRAAAHANGLPGKFVALLWGRSSVGKEYSRIVPEKISRAAEQPAAYGVEALRSRMDGAVRQLDAGRYAPGERQARYAVAGLARRRDWAHAARGAMALAKCLLKRGRPHDARVLLADATEYVAKTDEHRTALEVGILTGVALTDAAALEDAENVLQAAVTAAKADHTDGLLEPARLALVRCLFWRGRYGEAGKILSSIDNPEEESPRAVALAVAGSRLAVGERDLGGAITKATRALEAAERIGAPSLVASAACGAAFAHLAVGDRPSVDRDTALAIRAARAARDPLAALRARLLAAESHRRAGRGGVAMALLRRVRKMSGSALPPTVQARCALLSDLLSATTAHEVVRRHVRATQLEALALFAPDSAGEPAARIQCGLDDLVEILNSCQTAEEDEAILAQVCARLRMRLNALVVSFVVRDAGSLVPVACDGGGRLDSQIAERVMAAGQLIAPHARQEVVEGGTPVRYGGNIIGALVGRWTFGVPPDRASASMLLTTAATAAGPALAAAIARRRGRASSEAGELLGTSETMAAVRHSMERAAAAPFAVLIEGESGSGKELVARALHRRGPRRDRPFCTLNCAALPDDLVESELFGHARGAFTGAVGERVGVFEEAHTGTLLLDEIGELSLRAQAKVLRTIQEGELRRVGENIGRRVDVRLISATNRDLRQEVAAGRFRLDLLYRLDVIRIGLPPLRERREDIAILAEQCWRDATARVGSRAVLSTATVAALARYDWPGNVRELQNVLAALAVRSPRRGVVAPTALPPPFNTSSPDASWRLDQARRSFEERFVRAALVRSGGHRLRAAEELGVTRQGLTKLMTRLGITEVGQ